MSVFDLTPKLSWWNIAKWVMTPRKWLKSNRNIYDSEAMEIAELYIAMNNFIRSCYMELYIEQID